MRGLGRDFDRDRIIRGDFVGGEWEGEGGRRRGMLEGRKFFVVEEREEKVFGRAEEAGVFIEEGLGDREDEPRGGEEGSSILLLVLCTALVGQRCWNRRLECEKREGTGGKRGIKTKSGAASGVQSLGEFDQN